tara:strand:- start:637 stop:966 length:330 start_codon:yes stop_codon:yes gene_type:complete
MFKEYAKYYSSAKLLKKLKKIFKLVGNVALRKVLMLYIMLKSKDVPLHAKIAIVAVLGYLICPFDLIPDFVPGGLIDDLAAIALVYAEVSILQNESMMNEVDKIIKKFK